MGKNGDVEHDAVWKQTLRNLVAGTCGGWAQTMVGHPFDTVKVRMQTQPQPPIYKTVMQCVRATAKTGPMDFYKGVFSPLAGQGLMNACQYTTYGNMKILCGGDDKDLNPLTPERYLLVGALTGGVISFIDGPVDHFKIKMQAQVINKTSYKGVIDCFFTIVRKYGLRGVYQGQSGSMLRNIPCNGTYFYAYEKTRQWLAKRDNCHVRDLSASRLLFAGGAAGFCYWAPFYPIEVVKSTLQGDFADPAKRRYTGFLDAASKLYAQGGFRAFYRGYTPCLARSMPANAACFYAYETTRQMLE